MGMLERVRIWLGILQEREKWIMGGEMGWELEHGGGFGFW